MSIQSEINRISGNVSDALDAIEAKGVTIPSGSNSDDLADLIAQIQGGGSGAISIVDTTDIHGGIIREITAVDISDTTATASDVASGKYFYTSAGVKTEGTASGGGGLEYEEGTFTPSEDIIAPTINFANQHTGRPSMIMMVDVGTTDVATYSVLTWLFGNWYDAYGVDFSQISSSLARVQYTYRNTSGISNSTNTILIYDPGGSGSSYLNYYVSNTSFSPVAGSSRYWRAGRTYKWIAVWKPTA